MHSSASSPQVSKSIHNPQPCLTCLFPLFSPLSSYGTSLPRFAPSLHLHPDIAPITKQGGWVNYLYPCQYRHKPSPGSLSCVLLRFTRRPQKTAAALSRLWPAAVGTSCKLARWQSGTSCLGRCLGPGGSHDRGVSSIFRLTGLQQEVSSVHSVNA